MKIQASLKVMPTMNTRVEVYNKVNEVIEQIINSNLKCIIGPSETTVEGEMSVVFNLVTEIHTKLVNDNISQITMIIMTDYNSDEQYIEEKLDNVNTYLGNHDQN